MWIGKQEYAKAVKWAKEQGIVKGNSSSSFNPNGNCKRADFVVFLYRYAGSPSTTITKVFDDVSTDTYYAKAVTWAYKKGIIQGDGTGKFNPDAECTKIMALTMLYRYEDANINKQYNITYNLQGGTASENPTSYTSGESAFTINNPTKEGYTFMGWTGSNIKTTGYIEDGIFPSKTVKITTSDKGNKTYTANWSCNHVWNSTTGSCSQCGEQCSHNNWKDATCTKPKTCTVCGATSGSAKGHSWKDATCTSPKTCTICKATDGKAKGHTEVTDKAVEATCTKDGLTEGKHCSVCKEVLVAQKTIKAKGHTEVTDKAVEAICTKDGLTEGKHCSVCNEVIVAQKTISALGHDYKDTVIEPTATTQGYTLHTCTRCNDSYKDTYTKPLGKQDELYVESNTYKVEEEYILNIQPGTTVKTIKELLTTNATEIKIYKDNVELKATDCIGTGAKIVFRLGEETKEYILIILGDINGDGKADFLDIVSMNKHRLGKKLLSEEEKLAADVVEDGEIDFKDIVKVNKFRLNKIKEF